MKTTIREVFMHSKPKKNVKRSRTTIAGIVNYEEQTISLHGARNNTSVGETFKREIGRQVALGRARKHPIKVVPFSDAKTVRDIFNAEATQLIKHSHRLNPLAD